MDKDFNYAPLSESNVSLKLADIQRRCSELMADDTLTELSLEEEPVIEPDKNNPYNRG